MAGSLAAAMLGRAGVPTVLVDPNRVYPPDFRCEKLERSQIARLRETGLADELLPTMTPSEMLWVARYGHVIDRRADDQVDARYEGMVAATRALLGGSVRFRVGKVTAIQNSPQQQVLTLADDSQIAARVVVLATGPSPRLPAALGFQRVVSSRQHSLSIGFDLVPMEGRAFPFQALTWYPHRSPEGIAYLTLFPIGSVTRANLFVYWGPSDLWAQRFRDAPARALREALPGLERVAGPFAIPGGARLRLVDLYTTEALDQPGVVLIGDAHSSSCPAAGTGLDKVFTDVARLCGTHIPRWLAGGSAGVPQLRSFYADKEKVACDVWSLARAHHTRDAAVARSVLWRLRRRASFFGQVGVGLLRAVLAR